MGLSILNHPFWGTHINGNPHESPSNWTLPQVEAAEMPAIDNDLERRWPLMRILAGIPRIPRIDVMDVLTGVENA